MGVWNSTVLVLLAGALACFAGAVAAQAPSTEPVSGVTKGSGQAYPVKPPRMIVPFPPSCATDIVTGTPAQFADYIKAQNVQWGQLIKETGDVSIE